MLGLRDLFGDLTPPMLGRETVIVSPPPPGWNGDPAGTGTLADPFHSISTAIAESRGRSIALRGGRYNEDVNATGFRGTSSRRIVIQPYRREQVTIDCYVETLPDQVDGNPGQWDLVQHGQGVEEFIWSGTFPNGETEEVARGAFLETPRHTRLITYDHLEDLLSANELDPHVEDPRTPDQIQPGETPPGDNHVWVVNNKKLEPTLDPSAYRNWVYMGPGLWFDTGKRQLHLRLSNTNSETPGWPDYTGVTDPRLVKLALSKKLTPTLFLTNCHYLEFKDLTLRFGGRETIRIKDCSNLEFDHVNIRAGSRAIRFESDDPAGNMSIVFHDGEVDGGMPTWFFRSDRKDEYSYVPATVQNATAGDVKDNGLGKATTGAIISSSRNASDIEIHHCEIFNGHDLCIFGHRMRFHHNWVHNINDDALFMGSEKADTEDAWIYRNVITQVLSALSFSSDTKVGQVSIFRNLIDLREPTLGNRPRQQPRFGSPLRQGQFYKHSGLEGPFDLWHNTALVLDAGRQQPDNQPARFNAAGFTHYRDFEVDGVRAGLRRSYNNIFVATYSASDDTKPIAFLPLGDFLGPTDGNLYERVGPDDATDRFAVFGSATTFTDLGGYTAAHGWEQAGKDEDPLFITFDHTTGQPDPGDDDLRPRGPKGAQATGSPAKGSAIEMPGDMTHIDRAAGGHLAKNFGRDQGCYWSLTVPFLGPVDRMSVGVDGREKFPR